MVLQYVRFWIGQTMMLVETWHSRGPSRAYVCVAVGLAVVLCTIPLMLWPCCLTTWVCMLFSHMHQKSSCSNCLWHSRSSSGSNTIVYHTSSMMGMCSSSVHTSMSLRCTLAFLYTHYLYVIPNRCCTSVAAQECMLFLLPWWDKSSFCKARRPLALGYSAFQEIVPS